MKVQYRYGLSFMLLLANSCVENIPTAAVPPAPIPGPRFVEFTDGFYLMENGYYYWDGQPPPSDLAPTIIQDARASGMAPRFGTQGWVEAEMLTDGDQWKITMVYSLWHHGNPYYSNAQYQGDWKWRDPLGRIAPIDRATQPLHYGHVKRPLSNIGSPYDVDENRCGYRLVNGGTAYARKRLNCEQALTNEGKIRYIEG